MVIGGRNPTLLNEEVLAGLGKEDINLTPEQVIDFPPYELNRKQSIELLMARDSNLIPSVAGEVVDRVDNMGMPRIFRTIWMVNTDSRLITSDFRYLMEPYFEPK